MASRRLSHRSSSYSGPKIKRGLSDNQRGRSTVGAEGGGGGFPVSAGRIIFVFKTVTFGAF